MSTSPPREAPGTAVPTLEPGQVKSGADFFEDDTSPEVYLENISEDMQDLQEELAEMPGSISSGTSDSPGTSKGNSEAKLKNSKAIKNNKPSPKQLTHLTSSGEAHMVNITDKKVTARSAKARAFLYFGNEDTFDALHSATSKKGDALAVARVAGIQAAKKAADLIPLAHPGLGLTGVQVEILKFRANPNKEPRHSGILSLPQHGGVRITATVSCHGKTGVEMEALTSVTVTALTVYDMLKGVDKEMIITSARVLAKSGGKSGDWEWDTTTRRIRHLPPRQPLSDTSAEDTTDIRKQMQSIQIGKAKLKQEAEKLSVQKQLLQLEHEKSCWREERLRFEKEKLKSQIEELEVEKEKIKLANTNIREEIERGSKLMEEGEEGEGQGEILETERIRDISSGNGPGRFSSGDFERRRRERYEEWAREH